MSTAIFDTIGEPLKSFNGKNVELTTITLCIPKTEAIIQKYTFNGDKCDEWEIPSRDKIRWRFEWNEAPIDPDIFSLYVNCVYDVPSVDYYYVTIWLSNQLHLDQFNKYFDSPERIDWENLLQPWKQFELYSYKQ